MKAQLRKLPGTYCDGTAVKLIHEGIADDFAAVIYGKDHHANADCIQTAVNNHDVLVSALARISMLPADNARDRKESIDAAHLIARETMHLIGERRSFGDIITAAKR